MFIYLAGPLTRPCPMHNTHAAVKAADRLLEAGHVPFVPHVTVIWDMISPHHYEEWMSYDFAWITKVDALVRLPGESSGADREVVFAKERGIPVFFGLEEFFASHPEPQEAAT
jgi:nucleoside 2-deoxyribosyltransferase